MTLTEKLVHDATAIAEIRASWRAYETNPGIDSGFERIQNRLIKAAKLIDKMELQLKFSKQNITSLSALCDTHLDTDTKSFLKCQFEDIDSLLGELE